METVTVERGTFGWALEMMKRGHKVRRESWDKDWFYVVKAGSFRWKDYPRCVSDGRELEARSVLATDWTLYVEPEADMTFEDVVRHGWISVRWVPHEATIAFRESTTTDWITFRITGNTAERVR